MTRDPRTLRATVDYDEVAGRRVYVEELPDYTWIDPAFFDEADPAIVKFSGNEDDGFRAVFTFANGIAEYRVWAGSRFWNAELTKWEPT